MHLHQPHRWRDEFGLGQPERALKFLFGRSDGLRQDFGWSSSNPTGRYWAPWRPLNGMPLFGTGTAFISTVTRYYQGPKTHGRLMATCNTTHPLAPPTDRQPRRAAPNLHLQSSWLPSRLAPTAIPCRAPAGPIAWDAVASAWSPPPCPGRRCELAIRLAPAQACLDQSHVSRHTRGEGRALDQSNDLGISKWRVESYTVTLRLISFWVSVMPALVANHSANALGFFGVSGLSIKVRNRNPDAHW